MRTDFRQGIISYPSSNNQQVFLYKLGSFVSFQSAAGRTDITFAHGPENYLYTESTDITNAWGPLQPDTDYWLFWDINPTTAIRTFGITNREPTVGNIEPVGVPDLHWFNTTNNIMYVYHTSGWREVLRVFAAKIHNDNITPLGSDITAPFAGSQVGLLVPDVVSGRILVDNEGSPMHKQDGTFFTTETDYYVNGVPVNLLRPEANNISRSANENIARFQVVKITDHGKISLATYSDLQESLIGIAQEDLLFNQLGTVCLQGIVSNPEWNFQRVGSPLWVTGYGLLTEVNPHVEDSIANPTAKVPVARVISPTSIFFDQGLGQIGDHGPAATTIPYATDTVYGIAKLSVSAVNPATPIVVGDNDPRLVPYVHPTTHPATMISTDTYGILTGINAQSQLGQLADRSLSSLNDVTITSPTPSQGLMWNGTAWINSPIPTTQYLHDLLDVSITSPVTNQVLLFNGAQWNNINPTTTLTQDITGTGTTTISTTLATVNTNVGSFGSSIRAPSMTVTAKGLVTAAHDTALSIPVAAIASIDGSGGSTGLTVSGGPITTTGTLTLGGILNIASGGTGQTTATAAFNALAPAQAGNAGKLLTTDGTNTSWKSTLALLAPTSYVWGQNAYGELGLGDRTNRSSLVQLASTVGWRTISSKANSTVGIQTDGTLWTWGDNIYGQLGSGTTTKRSSPVQVGALTNWKSISCGYYHVLAIKQDNTLWAWGYNGSGQLGDGTQINKSSPIQIGLLTDWKQVAGGFEMSAAIKTDGTLWTWGANNGGQLGDGTVAHKSSPLQVGSLTDWKQVAVGDNGYFAAVKTDGTLWTCGYNTVGYLGDGTISLRSSPVQVGALTNWKQVACGQAHTVAVKTDGTLWAWGNNSYGELGNSSTARTSSPIQVGALTSWEYVDCGRGFTLAGMSSGTTWAWGQNSTGALGDSTVISKSSPIQIGSMTNWSRVIAGSYSCMAMSQASSTIPISAGGTGQNTPQAALRALLPSQIGQAGKVLSTDGVNLVWTLAANILP